MAETTPEDYNDLLKQFKILQQELNETKQNLYETSRQQKTNEALLNEYQNDIELLQSKEQSITEKFENKVSSLEETIASLRSIHSKNISCLEAELEKKEKENDNLKIQMALLEQKDKIKEITDDSMNLKEIIQLTNENEMLLKHVNELEDALRLLQNQNSKLEEVVEYYKEELDQNKENLQIKKEELLEKVTLIDKLNDELLCLNQELETYKNKPLEAESKGNSLFAEVDDRRVHLQKTINEMKSNYIRLKQEHIQHVNLISKLRKEKADMREQWKKDLDEMQEDNYLVPETLRRHVKVLEEVIEQQKKQLEQKTFNSDSNFSSEFQFYHQMIEDKSKEIQDWAQKYSNNSISNHLLSREVAEANKKARLLRLELEQLTEKLQEAREQNIPEEKQCFKCSSNVVNDKMNIQTEESISERILLKSCLKTKEEPANYDQTLDFTITKDYMTDDFNILHSEFTDRKQETSVATLDDITNSTETNSYHDTKYRPTVFDDKENKDSNAAVEREKQGVTFTEDTNDSVSKPVRRRDKFRQLRFEIT